MILETNQIHKEVLKKFTNGKDPEELESLKAFFAMKDSRHMPLPDQVLYMNLETEFRQATRDCAVLPTALDLMKSK